MLRQAGFPQKYTFAVCTSRHTKDFCPPVHTVQAKDRQALLLLTPTSPPFKGQTGFFPAGMNANTAVIQRKRWPCPLLPIPLDFFCLLSPLIFGDVSASSPQGWRSDASLARVPMEACLEQSQGALLFCIEPL